jgi:hypothetical protein
MEKYRVRRDLFGNCILQSLYVPALKTGNSRWKDVKYSEAPRALVSEFDVHDKIKNLEIEVAELMASAEKQ